MTLPYSRVARVHEAIQAAGIAIDSVQEHPDGRIVVVCPAGISATLRQQAQDLATAWRPTAEDERLMKSAPAHAPTVPGGTPTGLVLHLPPPP